MTTPRAALPTVVIRHATTGHVGEWNGMTMADLRAFVAENAQVADDACLIAVTLDGTTKLRGVGFFSLG